MPKQITEINFEGQNFYGGIDMHKRTWSVTVETDDLYLKTFSQPADKEALVRHFKNNYPGANITVGYEAGYFGFELCRYLRDYGINCLVLNPADIPTTQKEKDQKRDPLDSKKIARALRTGDAKPIWVPPATLEQDRQLLRTRKSLVKDITRVKNRIKAFLSLYGIAYPEQFAGKGNYWSHRFINWLEQISLKEVTATESLQLMVRNLKYFRSEQLIVSGHIRKLSRSERYQLQYNKLVAITGISMITAMTLLVETGTVTRFKNSNHFRSFIGLIPRSNSSGDKDYHGRITHRANHHLRSLLVESTRMAVRNDPYYLQLYNRYLKNMKGNKAIIRVAGKLANQIYYCMKNN